MKEEIKKTNKHKDVENNCLETFSRRLKETREARGMTQAQLAKAVNLKTEKINFAELNIKGRKIQIEELTEISKALNVLSSYLLGEIQTTTNNDNGLTDEANDTVKQWQSEGKLDILNSFILKLQKYNIINALDGLTNASYIKNEILGKTIDNIKEKVKEHKDLSHIQTQKIRKLIEFIDFALNLGAMSDYAALNYMITNKKEDVEKAKKEFLKLLEYNSNKSIEIEFEKTKVMEDVLDQFIDYTRRAMAEEAMSDIIQELVNERIEDKNYYKTMKY